MLVGRQISQFQTLDDNDGAGVEHVKETRLMNEEEGDEEGKWNVRLTIGGHEGI